MGEIIGQSDLRSTWGTLRSPMWKGSGYRNGSMSPWYDPTNTNESNLNNSSYQENLGELSVAFPFMKSYPPHIWPKAAGMCLGVRSIFGGFEPSYNEYGEESTVPTYVDFYLVLGEGEMIIIGPEYYQEDILNGYSYFYGVAGYDTLKAREQYVGGTVNLTYHPGPGNDYVTTDVTITNELFPDNVAAFPGGSPGSPVWGIHLGNYAWDSDAGDWPLPRWTINSLTMP